MDIDGHRRATAAQAAFVAAFQYSGGGADLESCRGPSPSNPPIIKVNMEVNIINVVLTNIDVDLKIVTSAWTT